MSTQHRRPRAARRIKLRDLHVLCGPLAAARALGVWLAAGAAGCSDPGEIVLVVQTDMSAGKDIDKIRIEVLNGDGAIALKTEYGTDFGDLKLPGTLGLRSSQDPEQQLTIRVSGELDGVVRVVRDVRTTLPDGGVIMLRAPLQWLCDSALLTKGFGTADCREQGNTCVAGSCASPVVTSATLPPYAAADVFGGGTGSGVDGACFDAVQCFEGATDVAVQKSGDPSCSIAGSKSGSLNIALRTEGDGFCGGTGCFVPLDAESDFGWREVVGGDGPRIRLPAAVCTHLDTGKVLGVATSTRCAAKSERTPTCGAWSQAGKWSAPDPARPVTLAAGQASPSSIAIDGSRVYWTSAGAGGVMGSVKAVSRNGGPLLEIASDQASPSGIAIDGEVVDGKVVDVRHAYWINEDTGAVMWARLDGKEPPLSLDGLGALGNLALYNDSTYDSVFLFFGSADNILYRFWLSMNHLKKLTIEDEAPVYVVADMMNVYWAFSGPGMSDGGLKKVPVAGNVPPKTLVSMQQNPLALVLDDAHIYWVNGGTLGGSEADGSIVKVPFSGDNPQLPGEEKQEIAVEQALPYAIAVDKVHVYWTNVGDGKVMKVPKLGNKDPVSIATGQNSPIAIVVDSADGSVYWANKGTSAKNFSDGSIMRAQPR